MDPKANLLQGREALEAEQISDAKQIAEWGGGRRARRRLKAAKAREARKAARERARLQKAAQAPERDVPFEGAYGTKAPD